MEQIIVTEYGIFKKVLFTTGKEFKNLDLLNVGTAAEAKVLFETELKKYPAYETESGTKIDAWKLVKKETVISYQEV